MSPTDFRVVLEEALTSRDSVRKRLARIFRALADLLDSDVSMLDALAAIREFGQAYATMASELLLPKRDKP